MMDEQEFYVGQIFVGIYPPEAADFCNKNRKIIMELSPDEETGKPRYQIQDVPEPTEREKLQMELFQKEDYLRSTDWMVIRAADNGVAVPEDIKTLREQARLRIDEIRTRLAELPEEESPFHMIG